MSQVLTQEVNTGDRLSFTIFIAIAVHAMVIFGIGFSVERGDKVAPNLNITLATHQSPTEPEKADFLAQNNQMASGSEQVAKELTVKDLADIQDTVIRDISPAPQIEAKQKNLPETRIISTEQDSRHLAPQQERSEEDELTKEEQEGEDIDTPLTNPEFMSLKAKLDRQKQAYAKMPRIRRLNSVSAKASYDAAYLNTWSQKIEMVGNENFPEAALRNDIYGSLRLAVLLLPNGAVERVEILQPSGYAMLDEAAVQIVRLASPFAPFPKEIRQKADKLEIIRTWRFEISGLSTGR